MKTWFVVRIKPLQHARAADNIRNQSTEFYHPVTRVRRRGVLRVEPLFPSYAFARPEGEQWAFLRSTRGVLDVLMAGTESPARVSEREIEFIRAREGPDGVIPIDSQKFVRGEVLQVEGGAFGGLDAIFDCETGRERVAVFLSILGRETRVELPERSIKRA